MSEEDARIADLHRTLTTTLEAIRRERGTSSQEMIAAPPLESLLDQCRALEMEATQAQDGAVAVLEHFACTGGTIISRCLAAMPNTVLLSEMDPLSLNHMTTPSRFAPTDLIKQMRYSRHELPDTLAIDIFLSGLKPLLDAIQRNGQKLVIRAHAHSQYCTTADWTARPSVTEIIARNHPVRDVLTVRHPLQSWQSLQKNGWVQFAPGTLEEYARRYLAFLDARPSARILTYEDFIADPEAVLKQICDELGLTYAPMTPSMVGVIGMSGNSGRAGDQIAARPSRELPDDLRAELRSSPSYAALCQRLNYPNLPDDLSQASG
ncbi:hypothetical protein CKO11_13930 [Rhodobacter sp. TJ_12]|uniref:sulfotransferase n=1 Tax=Rhodobacter sp. TJ_12 TaxID=2029399 RepID=UPI001CBE8173|nr:sulfotransferase [Rhodobacter sp. TJ_12]MBZ4023557.1 hypothetical protein [Rhodobacter sp. TJ_12]